MTQTTIAQPKRKRSITQIKLYLDIFLLISFILANIPQATGIPFHEWIGFFFVIPLMAHILLDWQWVVNTTNRLFGKLPGEVRFNHFWDLLIFAMMVLVVLTGTVVSESALPSMGIHITIDPFWATMHDLTANLLMIFIGVHLAMHWKWIVNSFNRYILKRSATPNTPKEGKSS